MTIAARALCSALLVASLGSAQSRGLDPHGREFDFWIGEWDVHNRNLREGKFRDSGTSRARIRPILGSRAILEEWDGRTGGHRDTFGISVRAFDPQKGRWVIVLNWPSPKAARFSRMEGSFRHGRGEFFPPTAFTDTGAPPRAERFTFSDGLANTCRWDMATPVDPDAWRTTWIMEFTRTRSKAKTIADGEPANEPPEDCVCTAPEARQLDVLVGVWQGTGWRTVGGERRDARATFRATSTNRGCATLCFLDVEDGDEIARSFEAWAFYAEPGKWVARAIDDSDPTFHVLVGGFDDAAAASFARTDRTGNVLEHTRRVRYFAITPDGFRCAHDRSDDGGESWRTVLEMAFERT